MGILINHLSSPSSLINQTANKIKVSRHSLNLTVKPFQRRRRAGCDAAGRGGALPWQQRQEALRRPGHRRAAQDGERLPLSIFWREIQILIPVFRAILSSLNLKYNITFGTI